MKLGVVGVGWHTFRHTVGTMLAEMGEHQLTIRDYLRHSNLSVTNKYLQAASKTKRNAQARVVEAILPVGAILPAGSKKQDVFRWFAFTLVKNVNRRDYGFNGFGLIETASGQIEHSSGRDDGPAARCPSGLEEKAK